MCSRSADCDVIRRSRSADVNSALSSAPPSVESSVYSLSFKYYRRRLILSLTKKEAFFSQSKLSNLKFKIFFTTMPPVLYVNKFKHICIFVNKLLKFMHTNNRKYYQRNIILKREFVHFFGDQFSFDKIIPKQSFLGKN